MSIIDDLILEDTAREVLLALLANPARYQYISDEVAAGRLGQDAATEKNISKAFKIAEQFKAHIEMRNGT